MCLHSGLRNVYKTLGQTAQSHYYKASPSVCSWYFNNPIKYKHTLQYSDKNTEQPISLEASSERAAELKSQYANVSSQLSSELKSLNRPESSVCLLAVSKYKPESDIMALYNNGVRHFGENYVQELTRKAANLPKDIRWHFIGALQSNKCNALCRIPNLYSVETVDSVSKCDKLNSSRQKNGASDLNVYIQVNTSNESQKSGISTVEEVYQVCQHVIEKCPSLYLKGLMTIGSFESSTGDSENKDFTKLSQFAEQISEKLHANNIGSTRSWGIDDGGSNGSGQNVLGLNMGMSSDFLDAVRQGSTTVRVGSTIFGSRPKKDDM